MASPLRLILFVTGLALALFWLSQSYDPQRAHSRVLRRCMLAIVLLRAWDMLPVSSLGVNPLSVAAVTVFGVPGIGMLEVLSRLP